jgi:peroxiredoxin
MNPYLLLRMNRAVQLALAAASIALALAACRPATTAPAAPAAGTTKPAASATTPVAAAEAKALFARAGFDVPSKDIASTDFSLSSLDGAKVSLSSYRGRTVVLSFWATWCGPCQVEMPAMQKLYESLRDRGFEILAVDVMEDKATVEKFRRSHGYTFPMLLDADGAVAGLYGAQALPTNYVIDSRGLLRGRVVGVGGPGWTSPEMRALFDHLLTP